MGIVDARDLVERGLLRIDAFFTVAALCSAQVKAWRGRQRETIGAERHDQTRIAQAHGEGIVRLRLHLFSRSTSALTAFGLAEEHQAWSARWGPRSSSIPPPARRLPSTAARQRSRTPAVEAGFEGQAGPANPHAIVSELSGSRCPSGGYEMGQAAALCFLARPINSAASAEVSVIGLSTTTFLPALRISLASA